ncbi:hypothetical protein ARSEF4850_000867 [Beauveria asiatica]
MKLSTSAASVSLLLPAAPRSGRTTRRRFSPRSHVKYTGKKTGVPWFAHAHSVPNGARGEEVYVASPNHVGKPQRTGKDDDPRQLRVVVVVVVVARIQGGRVGGVADARTLGIVRGLGARQRDLVEEGMVIDELSRGEERAESAGDGELADAGEAVDPDELSSH